MKENFTLIVMTRVESVIFISFWMWLLVRGACADFQKQISSKVVWTEPNGDAVLPCDIDPPFGDKINMILWFKDQTGIPIYSFDARGVNMANGVHMAVSDLEKRCSFSPSELGGGSLKIFNISKEDAGLYKCRVDFSDSPTQQYKITLAIAVLPTPPLIVTPAGLVVEESVGPYREGDLLELTCSVNEGEPTPQLSWWIDGEQLTGFMKELDSKISSHLIIRSVPRNYNGRMLECRVNVSGVSTTLSQSVRLIIYVKPIAVSILNRNNVITDGESVKFVCNCYGSNPAALISWLLDGEPIRSAAITVMHLNNTTSSTLTIRADPSFNEKFLFCKCENQEFSGHFLQDKKLLQVHYKPMVQILTRPKYNFNKIKEGDNASLECVVNANPAVNAVRWFHNGKMIDSENNKAIYHLKDVSLSTEGDYECEATNKEGRSRSAKMSITVLHAPFCQDSVENQSIMATLHETVILQCEVEPGSTSRHLRFFWTINNTITVRDIVNEKTESAGKTSILKYTPEVEEDFGVVACWAENDVGMQKVPCYFSLTLAHKPDRPRNCVTNASVEVLKIYCEPGFDGGLKQYFVLEIRVANNTVEDGNNEISDQLNDQATVSENKVTKPLYKLQKEDPVFDIFRLEMGMPYILVLYAVNLKGKSEPVVITQELKSSTRNIVSSEISAARETMALPSLYIVMIAIIILIASLVVMTAIILACRTNTAARRVNDDDLNNFRIAYSDIESTSKRASNYESEF